MAGGHKTHVTFDVALQFRLGRRFYPPVPISLPSVYSEALRCTAGESLRRRMSQERAMRVVVAPSWGIDKSSTRQGPRDFTRV